MELFKLSNLPFARETRRYNRYLDKYLYKISIKLRGIQYFRDCKNKNQVNSRLERKVYSSTHTGIPTMKTLNSMLEKSDNKTFDVLTFFDILFDTNELYFRRIFQNKIDIYTNSLELCSAFSIFSDKVSYKYVTEKVDYDANVIYLHKPKYNFRLFLNTKRLDETELARFSNFVNVYSFKPSRSFSKSLLWHYASLKNGSLIKNWMYVHEKYFLDFIDETLITIFAISFPDLIRKVCKIESAS